MMQYGVGPIGLECVRTVLRTQQCSHTFELVAAVDVDPKKARRDVGELLGLDEDTGITIERDAEEALHRTRPDVVLHTTTSFLEDVYPQIEGCIRHGAHVISSTEELAFPFERHKNRSQALDDLAREHGVAVVGTGVNPGYAMDLLPLMATAVCTDVRSVHVQRIVNAGSRRMPLQQKIGAGLNVDAFAERKSTGRFGHIGLRESLSLLAAGLGWVIERIDEHLEPVIAEQDVQTDHLRVGRGEVAGIHHTMKGFHGTAEVLSLDLLMYVGATDSRDVIRIDGTPPINLVVQNGIFGDTATVAMVVNTIPAIVQAAAGLRTMMDLPVPRAVASALVDQQRSAAERGHFG